MANTKLLEVARALYERTMKGDLTWEATPKEGMFQVSFPNYSILVLEENGEVTLKICNEEGRVVEELTESQATVLKFSNMREIFEGARRIAMGAEHALDELLRNLGRRAS